MTPQEISRYQLAAELLAAYEDVIADNTVKLADMPDGPEKQKLQRSTNDMKNLCTRLRVHYGSRSERTKDPMVQEVEEILGIEFDPDCSDQEDK